MRCERRSAAVTARFPIKQAVFKILSPLRRMNPITPISAAPKNIRSTRNCQRASCILNPIPEVGRDEFGRYQDEEGHSHSEPEACKYLRHRRRQPDCEKTLDTASTERQRGPNQHWIGVSDALIGVYIDDEK